MHPADRECGCGWRFPARLRIAGVFLAAAAVVALCACLGGCATTGESDMPWNAPQSWEGTPSLPGLTDRY